MTTIKSERELELLRAANGIVTEVHAEIERLIEPGLETLELDRVAERMICSRGARPAFKGYRGYPACICTSVNEQVVHGIPSGRRLQEGDIVSVDVGVESEGYYGDAAATYPVGDISPEAGRLLEVTMACLGAAIDVARTGKRISDISWAIQEMAEGAGFSVVRDYVGHGIGRAMHEEPQVPNFGLPGRGPRLVQGMVLAIEPMVNAGTSEVRVLEDDWTAVTLDGRLSAHFEHSVAVLEEGPEVLSGMAWESRGCRYPGDGKERGAGG